MEKGGTIFLDKVGDLRRSFSLISEITAGNNKA